MAWSILADRLISEACREYEAEMNKTRVESREAAMQEDKEKSD
jgi:hypothetical protein